MVKEVVVIPNSILRQKCKPIKKVTEEVKEIAKEMVDFLNEHSSDDSKPIGLSACQLNHSLRMIAFRSNPQSPSDNSIVILINPILVYTRKQYLVKENCLSIPRKVYLLKRGKIVKIRGTTLDGSSRSFRGRDLLGQVFQHELNHLDGILIDSIGELVRK